MGKKRDTCKLSGQEGGGVTVPGGMIEWSQHRGGA